MLVSAVIADGPPRRVLEAVRDAHAELILPKLALEELTRVLRMKLQLAQESASSIAALVEELAIAVVEELAIAVADPPAEVPALTGDPDDDRIIAAAVAAGAEVFVSGDRKHVLPLGCVGTTHIMRPQDLLAEIAH